jgi:tetratricopeptide (TPR) repeat protein
MIAALLLLLSTNAATPDFDALKGRATAAREAHQLDEAIQLYRRALRMKPSWAEGWWYLGTMQYDRNAYAAGRESLGHLVKLQPKEGAGWVMLGLCEFETKAYAEALPHIERGLSLSVPADSPLSKVGRYHSAILFTHSGQFEKALVRFSELAQLGAADQQTAVAAGLVGLRLPLFPSEVAAAKRDFVEQVGRVVLAVGARRKAEAQALFEKLLAANPDTPQLHYLYGTYLITSDPDGAMREWKREIETTPEHVPARVQIAFEYLKRGQAHDAIPYAEQAVKLDPQWFAAHNALGRALADTGDVRRAVAELERARDLAPDSAETRMALASAYSAAGRAADAARERGEFTRLKKLREAPQ